MDYVLSMEVLLHTTLGLEPGYLPEKDALHMLSGVSLPLSIVYIAPLFPFGPDGSTAIHHLLMYLCLFAGYEPDVHCLLP